MVESVARRQREPGDLTGSTPNFRPLYVQVKDLLIQRMVRGDWGPGEPLPTETALAEEFQVSHGTVRKALDKLAAENLVVRQQGRGTFVVSHTPQRALFHFFHMVGKDGSRRLPDSRLLSCERAPASVAEQGKLDLPAGAEVLRIHRVRTLDGEPAIIESIVLAADTFPGLGDPSGEELPNALYQLYEEQYGVTIYRAVEHLGAVNADTGEAGLLGVEAGTALLEIDRVAAGLDGKPVEWRVSRCHTGAIHYLNALD
jgi:GntR family transcriptional regulator